MEFNLERCVVMYSEMTKNFYMTCNKVSKVSVQDRDWRVVKQRSANLQAESKIVFSYTSVQLTLWNVQLTRVCSVYSTNMQLFIT